MNDNPEIVEKIRKLLRLGRGSNHIAEAQSAIAKAHELASRAGVNITDIGDHDPVRVTHEVVGLRRVSHAREMAHTILFTHFGVQVVLHGGRDVVYIGPVVNIELAKHVEEFLVCACAAAWREYDRERPQDWDAWANRQTKRSFTHGFYHAIHTTLANRPIRNDAREVQHANKMYLMALYPETRRRRQDNSIHNPNAALHGKQAGANVNLNRPVHEGCETKQLVWSLT